MRVTSIRVYAVLADAGRALDFNEIVDAFQQRYPGARPEVIRDHLDRLVDLGLAMLEERGGELLWRRKS